MKIDKEFEILYNWNNSLRTNDKVQFKVIQAKAVPLFKSNYTKSEIEEILIADGFKSKLVKEALNVISEEETEVMVDGDEQVEAKDELNTNIPKKYSDISKQFEKVLASNGPNKFVKLLTQGKDPLIKVCKKDLETFQKIADLAYENPTYMETLHMYLKPSIVSELAANVCKAKRIKDQVKITEISKNKFKITHGKNIIEASVGPVNSSNEKFIKSNYGIFNFPDEYVIIAYSQCNPYSQLDKDLANL